LIQCRNITPWGRTDRFVYSCSVFLCVPTSIITVLFAHFSGASVFRTLVFVRAVFGNRRGPAHRRVAPPPGASASALFIVSLIDLVVYEPQAPC
jgi:hypothetical protein